MISECTGENTRNNLLSIADIILAIELKKNLNLL